MPFGSHSEHVAALAHTTAPPGAVRSWPLPQPQPQPQDLCVTRLLASSCPPSLPNPSAMPCALGTSRQLGQPWRSRYLLSAAAASSFG